jgi:hypothetical protein
MSLNQATKRCEHGFLEGKNCNVCAHGDPLEAALTRARVQLELAPESPQVAPSPIAPPRRLHPPLRPENISGRGRVSEILREVAETFDVLPALIMSRSRQGPIAAARSLAWLLIRDELGWSYPAIGKQFGRDHTTVLVGVDRMRFRLRNEQRLWQQTAHLFGKQAAE